MEATIFTGWIYDCLLPHAEKLKVAHPLMLRAIAAAKKKNDKIDAAKIADCHCRQLYRHPRRTSQSCLSDAIGEVLNTRLNLSTVGSIAPRTTYATQEISACNAVEATDRYRCSRGSPTRRTSSPKRGSEWRLSKRSSTVR